ncbi:MAG: Minf_1886 family protein [Candidatus Omnitrophota bacterium]
MKGELDFFKVIEGIIEKDPRYKSEAYLFVMAALNYTVSKLEKPRHITGQELSEGIRFYTIEQFGPMARTVLEHWGVYTTEDFGNIVFNMTDAKLLSKTETDSIGDFKDVYDFKSVFDKAVEYKLE